VNSGLCRTVYVWGCPLVLSRHSVPLAIVMRLSLVRYQLQQLSAIESGLASQTANFCPAAPGAHRETWAGPLFCGVVPASRQSPTLPGAGLYAPLLGTCTLGFAPGEMYQLVQYPNCVAAPVVRLHGTTCTACPFWRLFGVDAGPEAKHWVNHPGQWVPTTQKVRTCQR
jgi:hypothetical protein